MASGVLGDSLKFVEKLDGTNFYDWKFNMRLVLEGRHVWGIVNGDLQRPTDEQREEQIKFDIADREAKAAIGLLIEQSQQELIRNCNTAREMWSALTAYFERGNAQSKTFSGRKLRTLRYEKGEDLEDHLKKISEIKEKLSAFGEEISEQDFCSIILQSV